MKKEVSPERKMIGGMNDDAYNVYKVHQNEMTNEELGVSDKRIIIPSFSTTSKLFRQHFFILRELRHRIDLLKQAYEDQRAIDRSWEQINQILEILEQGIHYLDFPSDSILQKMLVNDPDFKAQMKNIKDVFEADAHLQSMAE